MGFACINASILSDTGMLEGRALVIDGDKIARIIPREALTEDLPTIDLEGQILAPGFIDLQANGGNGVLFNNAPTVDSIRKIAQAHWQYGTTGLLPTLISDDVGKIEQAIEAVESAIKCGVPGIVGIHIEGPFLSPEKRGIHDADKIRKIDRAGLDAIRPVKGGRTLVTLAPDCVPDEHIRELHDRGILICAGHTNATYEELTKAFNLGVNGVTHLFNAMTQLGSREPGAVGAALDDADCWCCIIVDGAHVHPTTLRIAIRAKRGPQRFILVSDAMPTVGQSEKSFVLSDKTITVVDGVCQDEHGTLAGSDLDMASAVRNAEQLLGLTFAESLSMASANPAQFLNLQSYFGSLASGKRANMVALNEDGVVQKTWIDGRIVWDCQDQDYAA